MKYLPTADSYTVYLFQSKAQKVQYMSMPLANVNIDSVPNMDSNWKQYMEYMEYMS